MNPQTNKPLLVLNASAGSGKTYNLVRNFLRLLLQDNDQKAELSQLIAMTFTNKASIEMKTRIVQDLDKLAYGTSENDQKFRTETAAFINSNPELVQRNAQSVLKRILHQYEDFNVSTIDKFNLKLIRSFARDLDLPENFEIVINDSIVLNRAIDLLLDQIDKNQQTKLYQLITRFVQERMELEDSWDIKKLLTSNAQYLSNEKYFDLVKNLTDSELTEATFTRWKTEYQQSFITIKKELEELNSLFEVANLGPENFFNGIHTYNKTKFLLAFNELNRFDLTELGDFSDTYPQSIANSVIKKKETVFCPKFSIFVEKVASSLEQWKLQELKINQFHFLAILRELAIMMEDIRNSEAVIRVSEFNRLVAALVQNEEAPFIYERLGARYKHFFLDEFQDTSRLQWLNLVPLVHNSLAENNFNFIVGDPKQSIYRFKNGVAEQFVALPAIYNPEQKPQIAEKSSYFELMGSNQSLDDNWRSAENIVTFNNRFFTAFKSKFPEFGKTHYEFITQSAKGKKGGYVEFDLKEVKKGDIELELKNLEKWVIKALEAGYEPADICVLSKKTKACNQYALFLKSKGYQVVSSDSLSVDSDESVQLAIEFLRWKSDPENEQLQMQFGYRLLAYNNSQDTFESYRSAFEIIQENEGSIRRFKFPELLQAAHLEISALEAISFQNIYSLLSGFFRLLNIDPVENAYLYQLLDIAYKFDNSNGPILLEFLKFYDDQAYKTNVILPETRSSIQIMTAHKSKGLEFPVVIIPSLNFIDDKWSNLEQRLIANEDSFLSVSFNKSNRIIKHIDELYEKENASVYMDSANLLYVAFTRAVDALFVGSYVKAKSFGRDIMTILSQWEENKSTKTDEVLLEIGTFPKAKTNHVNARKQYETSSISELLWFPNISLKGELSNENQPLEVAIQQGKLFHEIMEHALSKEQALLQLEKMKKRKIAIQQFEATLMTYIEHAFSNMELLEILTKGKHLNEQSLIISAYETLRPDKIIVANDQIYVLDFKTGEPKQQDRKQVSTYVAVLMEIYQKPVSGYLYYANKNELKAVNHS